MTAALSDLSSVTVTPSTPDGPEDSPRRIRLRRARSDVLFRLIARAGGSVVLAVMLLVGLFLGVRAVPAVRAVGFGFLTTQNWVPAQLDFGVAGVLGRRYEGIPLLDTLPEVSGLTWLGVALAAAMWFVLYHTTPGLILRSAGESPATVDAVGISVARVRYVAVIFGGILAGVAGGFLSVAYRPSWTEGMTGGMGWIAIAIAIFASWDPLKAVWGAMFFGALYYLSFRLQTWVAPEALRMMPFAFTILVLAATARGRRGQGAPEALGIPYASGAR